MFKKKSILSCLLALFVAIPAFLNCVTYKCKEVTPIIGHNTMAKINNNGIVVGNTYDRDGQAIVLLYDSKSNKLTYLRAPDSEGTYVSDINNKNEIIGFYIAEEFSPLYGKKRLNIPYKWSKDTGFTSLKHILGHTYCNTESLRINDNGDYSGYNLLEPLENYPLHKNAHWPNFSSVIVKGNFPTVINHEDKFHYGVCLRSINNNSDGAGNISYGSTTDDRIGQAGYAFFWNSKQGKLIPIGNLGNQAKFYSHAISLNDLQQIVGVSEVNFKKNGHYCYHAFYWENGNMIDLGTIDQDKDSIANSINQHGVVVGKSGSIFWTNGHEYERAFVWDKKGGIRDLNKLTPLGENVQLVEAIDINDHGQIVCLTRKLGANYLVLLNPLK